MTKKEKFLMLVQTLVIVKDIKDKKDCGLGTLSDAMEIPEE